MNSYRSGRRASQARRTYHTAERLEARTLLATFVVTNTANTGDGSLRKAIEDANTAPGADVINFNIPGPGPHVIQPTFTTPGDFLGVAMPITGPVLIDGYTQATASPNTRAVGSDAALRVQLDGSLAPAGVAGVFISGAGVTVRGLSITRFEDGIILRGGGGSTIVGNFIGVTPGGAAAANRGHGVSIEGSPVNIIGGSSPADRNVISANGRTGIRLIRSATVATFIQGNYIGTDPAGAADMGNGTDGVEIGSFDVSLGYASRTIIGGTAPGARNVISGNTRNGIAIVGTPARENVIQGNYIGINAAGFLPIPNDGHGINLTLPVNNFSQALSGAASNNTIGGTEPGAGNVISGNKLSGIRLIGTANNNVIQGNFIGTNFAGNTDVGNTQDGIQLRDAADIGVDGPTGNLIGGTVTAAANIISGNDGDGIEVAGLRTGRNVIQRNRIGIAANNSALGNGGHGVFIDRASNQLIGYDGVNSDVSSTANIIARNGMDGVSVVTGTQNRISGNSIYGNAGGGIDLGNDGPTRNDANDVDTGANTLLNSPRITETLFQSNPAGVRLTGDYQGAPGASVRVEFFRNPLADALGVEAGKQYLGFRDYVVGPDGTIPFTAVFNGGQFSPGDRMTAIAIDGNGNTSEFASAIDLSPLDVDGNFELNATTGMYQSTGSVEISYIGGGPLVRIDAGTVSYNQSVIQANGTFSFVFGGNWQPLFTGSVTFDVGDAEAKGRLLVPQPCTLPEALRPSLLEVVFTAIKFGPLDVRFEGTLMMPAALAGLGVEVKGPNYFIVAPDFERMIMSGAAMTLPNVETKIFKTLQVELTGLAASYTGTTNTFKLQGAFKIKLKNETVNRSIEVNFAGDNYISIAPFMSGDPPVQRVGVNALGFVSVAGENGVFPIGPFRLSGLTFIFGVTNNELTTLGGGATVKLGTGPSAKVIEGKLVMKYVSSEWQLDELGLKASNLNVAIGTSGVFFQMIGGGVKGLADGDPPTTYEGTLGFSFGPQVVFTMPAMFGGDGTSDTFALVALELTLSATLDLFDFDVSRLIITASGTIKLIGPVLEGTASAELNFPERKLKFTASVSALNGFLRGNADLAADSNLNLTGSMSASVQVPRSIPVIGGMQIAGGNAYLQYRNNDTFSDDYIAGYGQISFFGVIYRIGAKMSFDGVTELLSAAPLAPLPPPAGAARAQAAGPSASFAVTSSARPLLMSAGWQTETVGAVPFRITGPGGVVYTEADAGGGAVEVVPALTFGTRLTVAVRDPAPGTWTFALTQPAGLGDVTVEAAIPLPSPTVTVASAQAGTAYQVPINYQALAPNAGTTVTLLYDTDAVGFDGKLIAAGLPAGDINYTWDTADVPPGDYSVYAIVSDARAAPSFAYAPGVVRVRAPRVTDVFVAGSSWTPAFKQHLAANSLGEGSVGFRVGAGASQLNPLPWANLDEISIRFDRPVAAELIDLALQGVNLPGASVAGITYDSTTRTATWRLAAPIRNDRVRLNVNGDAGGLAGTGAGGALDGEWAGALSAFPSGNGIAGGDFVFDMTVLPADVNRDGQVNPFDLLSVRAKLLASTVRLGTGTAAYSLYYDLNADGRINAQDLALARFNQRRSLPLAAPASASATGIAGNVPVASIRPSIRTTRRSLWNEPEGNLI